MKWEGGGYSVTLWPSVDSITYWKRWLPGEAGVEGAAWMEISKYVLGACSEHNSRCFPTTWRPENQETNVILCGTWWLLAYGEFCSLDNLNCLNYGRDPGRRSQNVAGCLLPLILSVMLTELAVCSPSISQNQSTAQKARGIFLKLHKAGDFPGSPVARTFHCHCSGHGFHPWLGN